MLIKHQILEKYGLTSAQLDSMEEDAANGILPGKPSGSVIVGRPLMFGEELKPVTFKEPRQDRDNRCTCPEPGTEPL